MLSTFKQFFRLFRRFFHFFEKLLSVSNSSSYGPGKRELEVGVQHSQFSTERQSTDETDWLHYFDEAKASRRHGNYSQAEEYFRKVISAGEKGSDWKMYAPPVHYANLAEHLYHCGRDEDALHVIERYQEFQERHGNNFTGLGSLKRGIETGGLRRLSNLYRREERLQNGKILPPHELDCDLSDLDGIGPARAKTSSK